MINRYGMGVPPNSQATPASAVQEKARMTMTRAKKTLWQHILHFFMKFNMCKCSEPTYEVLAGILKCSVCNKAAAWPGQPK